MGDQQTEIQLVGPMTWVGLIPVIVVGALAVWVCWPQMSRWLRRKGWLAPQRPDHLRRANRTLRRPAPRPRRMPLPAGRPATVDQVQQQQERPGTPEQRSPSPPAERDQTRVRVAALPPSVSWPLADARLDHLPVIYDGERWYYLDATASRHGVICGASRSGKGNLLQLLALTILAQGPERAEVWIMDPKGGLDYAPFLSLVHAKVFADVIEGDSPFDGDLSTGYSQALSELARRNRLLLGVHARNHHEYRERTGQVLPVLVLICDEVAELSDSQQRALATLARMSAAAGMVVWSATQYPTAASLPSQVQANALDRVVFQFPSSRYSAVALGLAQGERPVYEPSAIGERGVAVLRQDGREVGLGRVPLLGDTQRERLIGALRVRYGRATAQQEAVAPAATRSATEGATEGATPGSAPIEPPAAPDGALRLSDAERDELVRSLAGQGASQRAIRAELKSRGLSIAQDLLSDLHRQGRAAAALTDEGPEPSSGTAAMAA